MRYGFLFLVLGVSIAGLGALFGGAGWILLWPAGSFSVVGVAYLRGRPGMLGKRADGTLAGWALALYGPCTLMTWSMWQIERRLSREDAANEVAPGLWVGRRPLVEELPDGVRMVVDLTAELPAARAVRRRAGYVCVPVLDGTAPSREVLRGLLDRLEGEGGVLVHCASGHGRSATVAAAIMIARGLASGVDEAEVEMRRGRSGVRLSAAQRELLREIGTRSER